MDSIPFDVVPERVGLAEMSKYFDYRIELLRKLIEKRPATSKVGYETEQWIRKFMSFYGKILGALEFAVEFKHMPEEMSTNIEERVKNLIQYHTSVLIIGQG